MLAQFILQLPVCSFQRVVVSTCISYCIRQHSNFVLYSSVFLIYTPAFLIYTPVACLCILENFFQHVHFILYSSACKIHTVFASMYISSHIFVSMYIALYSVFVSSVSMFSPPHVSERPIKPGLNSGKSFG